MFGAVKTPLLKPSPAPTQSIKNPGGVQAPSGSSAAGQMVKNARGNTRATHKAPAIKAPKAQVPKYNALNSPYGNQKAFNKGVEQNAKSEYQPELNQLSTEESGEQGLHQTREGDNVNIYNQYSEQAKEAFNTAQSAMGSIAARQNSSTAAGQQALQAALSNTGVSGLGTVANQDQFTNEAAGLGNEGSQVLAGEQSGLTGEMAKDLLVPGAGLQEASGAEQARSNSVLSKIGGERKKVLANVPNIIAKTRTEMTKSEQEREANKLQQEIATNKLGLEKNATGKESTLKGAELSQKKTESDEQINLKNQELATSAGLESSKLQVEREKISAEGKRAKTAEQKVAAEAAGKRFDRGLEIMAGYLKENPKAEYRPGAPNAQQLAAEGKQEYRRDAQHLYNILTQQGNLTAPEAFRLMRSSGNGYIEQFATTHEAIYNKATHPVTKTVTNKAGGKQEQRLGKVPNLPKK